jgi:hypothetical protein
VTTQQTQYSAASSLLEDYANRPDQYWPSGPGALEHRQARKLKRAIGAAAQAHGTDTATVLARVISLTKSRAARRPPPIYVMGLGGSGSHWLSEMLAELLDAANCGEVYFPPLLLDRIEHLPPAQRGLVVDCLHIVHTFGRRTPPRYSLDALGSARAINSAGGTIHSRYKSWDPQSFVIHMLRDPRDQVVSVTFRKAGYRREVAPEASDDEYLMARAKAAIRSHEAWRDSPIDADFLCRYEDLRSSTADTLNRLNSALGEAVGAGRTAEVAGRFDAGLMQKGLVKPRGNVYLDDGQGSKREPNERQRALLHAELVEVRAEARYPADDCFGRALDPSLGTAKRRLRAPESATYEAVESLTSRPPDALDSLCLAGNRALDDYLLGKLAKTLHGLRELDLARTAITVKGLAHLAPLKALESISLIGTPAAESGESALRREGPALANCLVLI